MLFGNSSIITTKNKTKSYMLTWSIWTSCPQLSPASFSRARLARPVDFAKRFSMAFDFRCNSRISYVRMILRFNNLAPEVTHPKSLVKNFVRKSPSMMLRILSRIILNKHLLTAHPGKRIMNGRAGPIAFTRICACLHALYLLFARAFGHIAVPFIVIY